MRVLIIGGGVAGLSLAWRLCTLYREHGLPLECTLAERDPRLGGKILTHRDDPYVVEGGPDSFITAKPAAAELCRELGLGDHLVGTLAPNNKTFILREGTLHLIPAGLVSFVPSDWGKFARTRLLSMRAKLRMASEWLVRPDAADSDPSMGAFFRRRLGKEAWQWLVEPLLAGIYTGVGDELSLTATFPRFIEMVNSERSLMRAALKSRRNAPPPAASSLFGSLSGGLGQLIETLAERLRREGVTIRLGCTAERLRLSESGAEVELDVGGHWRGEVAALCVPAFAAADLLEPTAPSLATQLRGIEYCSSATITLAYNRADIAARLDGYGFVVPRAEGRSLLACTWVSSKWSQRAPAESALLRCFVGGCGREQVLRGSDEALIALARRELDDIMGIRAAPLRSWIDRWDRSMPQYKVGHLKRVAAIEAESAKYPSLALAGAAYRGVGIPDCIADGERAAEEIFTRDAAAHPG